MNEATKRVRVERIVRRDHPAEVTAPQGDTDRSLAPGKAGKQPRENANPVCPGKDQQQAVGLKHPKTPAGRSGDVSRGPTRELGVSEEENRVAFALTRLTPELSRAAKRRRLE